jgi:signal peptidase II
VNSRPTSGFLLSGSRRNDLFAAALALLVIVADQLTKRWIVAYFQVPGLRRPIPILSDWLTLDYTQNTGVAFSLFAGQAILFLFISCAVAVVAVLYWRVRNTGGLALKLTFGLILGGAAGNLIDRFTRAFVVDFIHFQIPGHFDWPVFNVADSAVSVGVVVLAYLLWRGDTAGNSAPAPGDAGPEPGANARPAALGSGEGPGRAAPPATPRVRNPHARAK